LAGSHVGHLVAGRDSDRLADGITAPRLTSAAHLRAADAQRATWQAQTPYLAAMI